MRCSQPTALLLTSSLFLMGGCPAEDDPAVCEPAPRTGCTQSENVAFTVIQHASHPKFDFLSWSWHQGEETTLADLGDPTVDTDYALCVYDGAATAQTELEAPAPGTDSLVLGLDAPSGRGWVESFFSAGFDYFHVGNLDGLNTIHLEPGDEGEAHALVIGSGAGLGLDALEGIDGDQVISQIQASNGQCFGAQVGVSFTNGPQFPASTDVLDADAAEPALDELASLYNRKFGDEPLNMTLWISALAATDIQNLVANSDPVDLDTTAIFSALHVAGWYGGMWFARDGFQFPAPPGPNPSQLGTAEFLYAQGRDAAVDLTDSEIFDFLTNEIPVAGSFDAGTGLRSVVSLYGYNTGYALTVTEDTAGGVIVPPPPSKLDCEGTHPPLIFPPFLSGDGPLFGCSYDPSFFATLDDLRPFRDDFVAAFPAQAEQLRVFQGGEEVRGRQVWTFFLGGVIKKDQAVREALWDVDNAFLEVVHGAGLLNMGAQAHADADLGRRAVIASSSVLKGWLTSYQYGLGAPEPRVLPRFDLGETPIQSP